VIGAVISVQGERLPTGPMIILTLTAIVLVSLALAPRHGVLPEYLRQRRNRRALTAPPETPAPRVHEGEPA
jgi:manganese/zinc/iron transport system permease protein